MTDFIDRASVVLISLLATSAVRAFVLAGLAVIALAIFRPKTTSVKLFSWTSVLYASMALPWLGWIVPALQVRVPEFLHNGIRQVAVTETRSAGPIAEIDRQRTSHRQFQFTDGESKSYGSTQTPARDTAINVSEHTPPSSPVLRWNVIAAGLYLLATVFFLIRFLAGMLLSRKLVRGSQIVDRFSVSEEFHGRSRSAQVAMSELISVPITIGIFRPTILLPANWREWDSAKLSAVLAHERSHVARWDPLTQCISLAYRAFFWFSPLSWWLHRHLAALAEEASDEAALSRGADQKQYARTLLSFFETLQTTPGRVRWQGVSMARAGQAARRLERILSWKGTVGMNLKRSFAIAFLVLVIPVVLLVAAVRPVSQASANVMPAVDQTAPSAPAAAPTGEVSAAAPVAGVPSTGAVPAVAPVAPTAPVSAVAPNAPVGGFSPDRSRGFHYSYGFDDEERFVIANGKSDSYTMSGSTQDIRHVEKLKKEITGDFIWFQRDEESYIIRDQATVDRARKLFAPQEELGKKQEELGKQQEALGKQQEELGKKMEQVRVNVPDMTAELDRLKSKLQKLGSTATLEQVGDLQSEIGELQSKIGEIQSHAGEQQGKLGELQGELGEKQGKLGEQQGELGRQQAELGEKAAREMKGLLDQAIKDGTAKPERENVKAPTL